MGKKQKNNKQGRRLFATLEYALSESWAQRQCTVDQRRLSTIAIQRTFIFSPTVAAPYLFSHWEDIFALYLFYERADIFSAAVTHFDINFVEQFL